MEDIELICVVEGVRESLTSVSPEVQHRLEELASRNFRNMTATRLQEVLVQVAHAIDISHATGIRELSAMMMAYRQDNQLAIGGAPVYEINSACQSSFNNLLEKPGNSADHEVISEKAPRPRMVATLQQCANLEQAAALVARTLPALTGMKAFQYLCEIGYPAAVPARETQRFLKNLGLLRSIGDTPEHRRSFFQVMERASRLTGLNLSQIDLLFRIYCGAEKVKNVSATCGRRPACNKCTLQVNCPYGIIKGEEPEKDSNPIKQWARDERPRERLLSGERLTNAELLGIILRTGTGTHSAVELGRQLMKEFKTLHALERASPMEIVEKVKGIGPAKAAEIKAAIELGSRVVRPAADERDGYQAVLGSNSVFDLYRTRYKAATQEEFLLLILNIKNKIQREVSISVGTINKSIVHPRDVFHHALREAAASVIFVHNHPSGDPTPSPEDNELTNRLYDAGKLLGIEVVDHVIVGAQRYYSYRDAGRLGR